MPEADDAPARPSTWQLLFGANKKHPAAPAIVTSDNQQDDAQPRARSPTISDVSSQLLKALQSREGNHHTGQDDAIGRQCSDELLGKPNAFAPQWRNAVDTDPAAPEEITREAKQQAQELIHARLRVDQHAEAIRRGKTREQQRRDDSRLRPATRAELRPRGVEPGMTERLKKLREIQSRRDANEKAREDERLRQERLQHVASRETRQPTQKKPTAARPELITTKAKQNGVASTATKHHDREQTATLSSHAGAKTLKTARVPQALAKTCPKHAARSNQDDTADGLVRNAAAASGRDLRLLDDKLRQLQTENQRVAALDDRLRAQQHVLRIKRRVWAIWQHRVEGRRRHEASVARAYDWRQLQRVWAAWRHAARAAGSERAARLTREQLLRDKQQHETAERFHRARCLVLWFQRWRAEALAARDTRQLDAEMQRRREKAARLVERLARAQTNGSPRQDDQEDQCHRPPSPSLLPPRARGKPTPGEAEARTKPTTKEAWAGNHVTTTRTATRQAAPESSPSSSPQQEAAAAKLKVTSSAASPDAFYVSMLERAEQRKAQREQLKLKYEKLQQEKRDALARQVAEREALLEQQKQAERERLREKKREDARVAREKAAQRHVASIQQQSAVLHDRLRLLYHYAFRPWQHAWRASSRVARNAAAWHVLRVCHSTWHAWRGFVRERHAQRHREEQARLAQAAEHHRLTLLRGVVAHWKLAQRATDCKQLAVRRQVQWNATRRAWRCWHHAYALAVGKAQQRETHARRTLVRRRLRGLLVSWREAAVEAKRERVRQAEKELLWKKARMWLNE